MTCGYFLENHLRFLPCRPLLPAATKSVIARWEGPDLEIEAVIVVGLVPIAGRTLRGTTVQRLWMDEERRGHGARAVSQRVQSIGLQRP
jgi:hypothetical protein